MITNIERLHEMVFRAQYLKQETDTVMAYAVSMVAIVAGCKLKLEHKVSD